MIREVLHSYALASARIWTTDRSQTVGASEIGQCARKTAFAKAQGDAVASVPRDEDHEESWGAACRGALIEDHFWVPAMKARFGDDLLWAGDEQRTFVSGYLSATPDGVLVNQPTDCLSDLGVPWIEGEAILLDCKSIDPRARLDAAKPEHEYQMIVGMGVVREVTNYRPECAVLSYIDASFFDKTIEFAVRFDPNVYATAKDRARQIMTAQHGADLRPEGIIAGGKECDFCPFTTQCGWARSVRVPAEVTAIAPALTERITTRARLAKIKEAGLKRLEADIGELKQGIRDDLQEAGSKGLPGVVSWASVKGREGWDDKAIRDAAQAAGVDLAPFKKVGDASDRLTITLKA